MPDPAAPAIDPVAMAVPADDPAAAERLVDMAACHMAALAETALGRFARQSLIDEASTSAAEQALGAAALLRGEAGKAARSTLAHPAFCHWVKGAYRLADADLDTRGRWMRHAADFLWPLAASGHAASIRWRSMLDDRGGLRCIAGRRYFEFGAQEAGRAIMIESDPGDRYFHVHLDGGATVHVPFEDLTPADGDEAPTIEEHGYEINHLATIGGGRIEFGHRDPALRVRFTGTHQRRTGVDFFGTSSALLDERPDRARFDRLIGKLAQLWPAACDEMLHLVRVLVPVKSAGESRLGFTVSSRQGAIFLEDADDRNLLRNWVHEAAHVKLRHLQIVDRMMDDWGDETRTFKVPWRDDPRPLAGIFEGVFVFTHVRELERRMVEHGFVPENGEVDRLGSHIAGAAGLLHDHAPLTPLGHDFLTALCAWAAVKPTAAVA